MTDPLAFLAGGGEASRIIRERDWTGHSLGPPEGWPAELRASLSLVLNSPESMILAWGPDLTFFNETYFPLLGPRLAWAMGERFEKVWADAWDQAKPISYVRADASQFETALVNLAVNFTLYLPEAEAAASHTAEEAADESALEGRSLCVPVVEDYLEVGRFCTQILEDLGHSTVWAHSAEVALVEIERVPFRFEAVFSDVVMPGIGGIELGKRLRERHPDLPVILTLGYSDVLARDDGHGFDLVRKPYSAEQVAKAFRKIALPGRPRRRGPTWNALPAGPARWTIGPGLKMPRGRDDGSAGTERTPPARKSDAAPQRDAGRDLADAG